MFKLSYIKKMPNGKYRVLSEEGKNLGESDSRAGAEKRLQEVEIFKHMDRKKKRKKRKQAMKLFLIMK